MSKKIKKYNYIMVIQFYYAGSSYGWCDVSEYEQGDYKNARHDLREYRLSGSGGAYRLINRRELNPLYAESILA